jgi:hypothetical protein
LLNTPFAVPWNVPAEVPLPISAVDTITLAFQHTKRQLFQPFRFGQWTRLAVVGLLAGEAGSSGGFNFPTNFNIPQQNDSSQQFLPEGLPHIDPAILGTLIAVLVVTGLIFVIVMLYVSSVMRFVLFDSVLTKTCRIREGWSRRQGPGWHYFLWQLGYTVVTLSGLAVLLGVPAAYAYSSGWFREPGSHVGALVLCGILVFCLVLVFFAAAAVVHVFTKDFVVPQMALEGIDAIEGWRRLWPMMQQEGSRYAGYVGMKIVLAIGAGIILGIVGLIVGLLIAIPAVVVTAATIFAGKAAGLTWNALTITAAVVAGCVALAILLYTIALISVPITVFFPAYAMYFFAARYRALSLALYPLPPTALSPPPQDFPPVGPSPAPA